MSNSAAIQLAAVPALNRDRPPADPIPSEAALTPARGAWQRLLLMVTKAPEKISIPYAFMGTIVVIIGLVGFMYTQSVTATKDIQELKDRNAMADTRVEILNNKVLILETSNKFAEQMQANNDKLDQLINLMKQQRR